MEPRDKDKENPQLPEPPLDGREQPRRLLRSRRDRVLAGVCGGLGQYFGIDPVIFRIALVALIFAGGVGILVYLGCMLLIPAEAAGADDGGRGPRGSGRDTARRLAIALGIIAVCGLIAIASGWAAGVGGTLVGACLVIGAGVALVVASFLGHTRWLILPALAVAIPVALVSAADVDLRGGAGERDYHPRSPTEVRDRYKLGMGRLVLDLRDANLPPGDKPLSVEVGVGEALLLVPENVCVATQAKIGIGAVQFFDRDNGGVDLDWQDAPKTRSNVTRLVVDAKVGLGSFEVRHRDVEGFSGEVDDTGNVGCSQQRFSKSGINAT